MKRTLLLGLSIIVLASCSTPKQEEESSATVDYTDPSRLPEVFVKGLEAHGGLENWQKYQSVSYDLVTTSSQKQLIDLYSRKVRITDSLYTLGYDGERVWVSPDLEAYGDGSPRFMHNLYFYFFAMPFVLADEGINYESLGEQTIDGTTYNAVKMSYNDGVGDSPEDFYIAHFSPETGQMELLLYTVTYFSGEAHENYGAIKYQWQMVDDLLVTQSITGYKYDSGRLGDQRYYAEFENVLFSKDTPGDSLFSIPNVAEIDSVSKK